MDVEEESISQINDLMRVYQSAKRYSFNRLWEDQSMNDIKKDVMFTFNLNARYAYASIVDAKAVLSSQKELIKEEIIETKEKIGKSRKKLEKTTDALKRKGIQRRIDKLSAKLHRYEKHLAEDTIPKVVFGGKKNLRKLQEGRITKDEWRGLRSNAFYSIGGRIDGGNQNLRITHVGDNLFQLRINVGTRKWMQANLWIPSRYVDYLKQAIEGAYSVRVVRRGRYEVHISSDHVMLDPDFSYGVAGIDVNTDNISATIASRDGNFKASKVFPCNELLYARSSRREWLLGNLVKEAFEWVKSHNVKTVAVENLKLRKTFDTNKRFNRKISNFIYAKTIDLIKSRAIKEEIAVKEANPRYSSFIGEYKYALTYGLSTHQAAALVLARRAMGYLEKIPKIMLMFINFVKRDNPLSKTMEVFKKWGLLYGVMKRVANSKLRNVLYAFGSTLGLGEVETVNSILHGANPCPTRQ
ncbi:MAG: IS200/IS605 family accessory protein TnpB-related protein [Candidatus Altiarchaeota archaeon]|nr:IS200/IS605 family accessory protein TnpB-related protein [Candidatus Altiarchaeota archaeon]